MLIYFMDKCFISDKAVTENFVSRARDSLMIDFFFPTKLLPDDNGLETVYFVACPWGVVEPSETCSSLIRCMSYVLCFFGRQYGLSITSLYIIRLEDVF